MSSTLTMEKSSLLSTMSPFDLTKTLANVKSTFYESFGGIRYENSGDYSNLITETTRVSEIETIEEKNTDGLIIETDGESESQVPQFITYIDHPHIETNTISIDKSKNGLFESKQCNKKKDEIVHWDSATHFYFGSLTVIGLYVLFKVIQKSK